MPSLRELLIQRDFLKYTLMRFQLFVNKESQKLHPDVVELDIRIEYMKKKYKEFCATQSKIDRVDSKTSRENHEAERQNFLFFYCRSKAQAEDLIKAISSLRLDYSNYQNLPTFNGNATKWRKFKRSFENFIKSQPILSDAEKLFYLNNAILKDEATNAVEEVNYTNETFTEVWKSLNRKYGIKKVTTVYIDSLLNLPTTERTYESLTSMQDEIDYNIDALQAQGYSPDRWDQLLIQIIVQKLDPVTKANWKEKDDQTEELPTLDSFLTFLTEESNILTNINEDDQNQRSQKDTHAQWIRSQKCRSQSSHYEDYSEAEATTSNDIDTQLGYVLNKVTVLNVREAFSQIVALRSDTNSDESLSSFILDLLFETAVERSSATSAYAMLCQQLSTIEDHFRISLSEKCEEAIKVTITEDRNIVQPPTLPAGFYEFVGYLFVNELLTSAFIMQCLNNLLYKDSSEYDLKCFFELLKITKTNLLENGESLVGFLCAIDDKICKSEKNTVTMEELLTKLLKFTLVLD